MLVALLALLALAPAASAEPHGIRHNRHAETLALAGPDVLVLSNHGPNGNGKRLVAVPRAGGRSRELLTLKDASLTAGTRSLVASPRRVGVMVDVGHTHRVYSGPPSGPLKIVRRTRDRYGDKLVPERMSVDGDRLLLIERDEITEGGAANASRASLRVSILDAAGWHPLRWASAKRLPVAIAGRYAAVDRGKRVELADLTTGATILELAARNVTDLEPDGRITAVTSGSIVVAGPGRAQRAVAKFSSLRNARFDAGSLVGFDSRRHTLSRLKADWTLTALGPKSLVQTALDADAKGVAWLFNGCVRYAPLAGAAKATGRDPCPTTEVGLYTIGPSSKLRAGTAKVAVKCVTAPKGRCKGEVVVREDYGKPIVGRGRFNLRVAPDRWQQATVRFTPETAEKFRREHGGSLIVNAIMRNGTVGTGSDYSSEFSVDVDERS